MQHIYDTIIIGGGPAGYTAALYTARAGLDVLITEKMSIGGQMTLTGEIDNYPGFDGGIDGITLGENMRSGAERFGAKTLYAQVNSVNFEGEIKLINTDDGQLRCRSVIIATGASHKALGLPDEQALIGRGIHYCAHCDGRFYKDKTVAVVGGGNSAVSDAVYLSNLAKKVYLIHRRDSFRADRVLIEALGKHDNIELVTYSAVVGLLSDRRLCGISVKNLQSGYISDLSCDGLFVNIGMLPSSDIFRGAVDIDRNGYIVAGEDTKTNVSGVFVIGDVRTKPLRQIITAAADGAVASHFVTEYLRDNPLKL